MKTTAILGVFAIICLFIVWFTTPVKRPNVVQSTSQTNIPPIPPGTVVFNKADVSLVPGAEWQQLSSGPFTDVQSQSICFPVLEGEGQNRGCLIQVFTTDAKSDAKTAADILKKEVDADSNTTKGTFKEETFVSNYRVPVEHVSYDYEAKGVVSSKKLRAHVYLFQNKQHNCIAIHYITFIDKDSARVDQMIRDTLKWN